MPDAKFLLDIIAWMVGIAKYHSKIGISEREGHYYYGTGI
jgi:hypothetical protein